MIVPTLITAFDHTLTRRRDDTAVFFEGAAYSFGDIERNADSVAAHLAASGIEPGDRVAVGLANSVDLIASVLGVIRAGAVLVPLNPAYTADEVVYAVGDAAARLAIVEADHAAMLADA